jgi:hypothetical protein
MKIFKCLALLCLLLIGSGALSKPIPGDPYYTTVTNKKYTPTGLDHYLNSPTLERIYIDGQDHAYSQQLISDIKSRIHTTGNCQLRSYRHRLFVSCYNNPKAHDRARFGDKLAQKVSDLQGQGAPSSSTTPPSEDEDEYPQALPLSDDDRDYASWLEGISAADVQSIFNVMGSIFDGGFKHDNRNAGEQIAAMEINLEQRLSDLKARQQQLDDILTSRKARVNAQYTDMNQRYSGNSTTIKLQANYHHRLLDFTLSDIDQRVDNTLPPELSPAAIQQALLDQFNPSSNPLSPTAGPLPEDYPNTLLTPSIDSHEQQRQAFARERFKQQYDFAASRERLRQNLASGQPDPVFKHEADVDLVEVYGRYKVRLAENIASGEDSRSANFSDDKRQRIINSLLRDARSARYFAGGLVAGLSQSVIETALGFVELPATIANIITNADDIALALYDSAVNYEKTSDIIYEALKREWVNYQNADESAKGKIIGKILGNVTIELAGPGMAIGSIRRIGKLGKLGRLGKTATRMDNVLVAAQARIAKQMKKLERMNSADPEILLRASGYRSSLGSRYLSREINDVLFDTATIKMQEKLSLIDDSLDGLRAQNRTITNGHYDYLYQKAENLFIEIYLI